MKIVNQVGEIRPTETRKAITFRNGQVFIGLVQHVGILKNSAAITKPWFATNHKLFLCIEHRHADEAGSQIFIDLYDPAHIFSTAIYKDLEFTDVQLVNPEITFNPAIPEGLLEEITKGSYSQMSKTYFDRDTFTARRSGAGPSNYGNAYDPESLITGAEEAAGLTYHDPRRWPNQETYDRAVAGEIPVWEIPRIAPRIKVTKPVTQLVPTRADNFCRK